jgi:excisionase family DNA binding protein
MARILSTGRATLVLDTTGAWRFYRCMTPTRSLLTASEAAEMLSVHRSTIVRWANEGIIKAVSLPNGRYKFRREDIEAILTGTPAA